MIAIPHPIRKLIDTEYFFLSSMINRFPSLLNDWVFQQEKEVEQLARELAQGDNEVYSTVYSSEIARTEDCYEEKWVFNNAMLLMAYSYYESMLYRISKEKKLENSRPSTIAKASGAQLDKKNTSISEFMHETIRNLRNELCHNNNGTLFSYLSEKEKCYIIQLANTGQIKIDDVRIMIISKSFVEAVLDDAHELLITLADICGYKTLRLCGGKLIEDC